MFIKSWHQIIVTGRIIKELDLRYDEKGEAFLKFSIPTNNLIKVEGDEPYIETTWFDITLKGKDAEVADRELDKDDNIQIIGTLKPEIKIRELRDGRTVGTYEVVPKEIIYLQGKNGYE